MGKELNVEFKFYDNVLKETYALLDKINMSPFFEHNMTPQELRWKIEDYVENDPQLKAKLNTDYFQHEVFNWMDDYELMEYVHKNYGVRFTEIVEYRLR